MKPRGVEAAATQEFDFIIVGSGGGSVPAALVMKDQGKTAVIIEKLPVFGGTSAYSGGVIWIPNNHIGNPDGSKDSPERARRYMDTLAGASADTIIPQRRDAYVRGGPEMVRFLEAKGMKFLDAEWPDYHDEMPGGRPSGRSLSAPLFNANELGDWAPRLAQYAMTTDIPMSSPEAVHLFVAKKTWRGKVIAAKIAGRIILKKLFGRDLRGAGPALMGRLFQIARREQIPVWTDTPVHDLLVEEGRVVGVRCMRNGQAAELRARLGVLINAGGFSRNREMREQYQPKPTSVDWTQVNPGDTGEMIQAAMRAGGAIDFMNEAWWLPSSFHPDGSIAGFHSPNDFAKPHCIVVGKDGRRFANEASGYMEMGQRMYAAGAVPAWAIFDSRHRQTYPWGTIMPGRAPKKHIESGYLKQSDTLAGLATRCGIDPVQLSATVSRFNSFAKAGVDKDFGRGESAYNHYYGDPTVKPNPNLGSLEKAPFYAVAIYPSDVGTAGGIVADEYGRALREDGSVIEGLYVTGNSSAAVMGRCYPGAGSSIGPSMVFGYLSARHAAGAN
ncbi:MAG TPA: FAD-binding protein [Sphingobium sp.]|uniref:FAD-binding protein n=1 Tax=Sphingobium sp. TaxID=1912891 RepID=UPI002ED564E5